MGNIFSSTAIRQANRSRAFLPLMLFMCGNQFLLRHFRVEANFFMKPQINIAKFIRKDVSRWSMKRNLWPLEASSKWELCSWQKLLSGFKSQSVDGIENAESWLATWASSMLSFLVKHLRSFIYADWSSQRRANKHKIHESSFPSVRQRFSCFYIM